jgi:hypothetical protein
MKTDVRSLGPALAPALLVFALLASPAAAQKTAQARPGTKAPAKAAVNPPPPPAGKAVLQDRVLAVVDEDPILASEIQKRVAEIRARYPDEAAFQKALKEVGLDLKGLRQLVARQLLVLTYVDERLGARAFVEPEDINRYYRDVLTPEMRKRGQQPPPLDEVREDIRETVKQQKLTQEMANWTRDLRAKADVLVYSGNPKPNQPLPPVVKTIQGKADAKGAKKTSPVARKPPV